MPDNELTGKTIIFLGSSVTYGASSLGDSFVDYIEYRNNCKAIKEAVSGTTLVDEGAYSYVSRLNRLNVNEKVDAFVCQLSTNDASRNKTLGEKSSSFDIDDFDTKTIAGAIEYIIAFAKENYRCPIVFYTSPKFESENYQKMVEILKEIETKWNIVIIDMWNDEEFNNIRKEQRDLYMADSIHPTKAGYIEWWTPYFEKNLIEVLKKKKIIQIVFFL